MRVDAISAHMDMMRACRTYTRVDPFDRLMESVDKDTASGCWLYVGTSLRNGYAAVNLGGHSGRLEYGHRLAYARYHRSAC